MLQLLLFLLVIRGLPLAHLIFLRLLVALSKNYLATSNVLIQFADFFLNFSLFLFKMLLLLLDFIFLQLHFPLFFLYFLLLFLDDFLLLLCLPFLLLNVDFFLGNFLFFLRLDHFIREVEGALFPGICQRNFASFHSLVTRRGRPMHSNINLYFVRLLWLWHIFEHLFLNFLDFLIYGCLLFSHFLLFLLDHPFFLVYFRLPLKFFFKLSIYPF